MIHGLDTGFLVAAEVTEHGEHTGARATLARLLAAGDLIAIAPQVLAEFMHIVTDPRRFIQPLDMTTARQLAEQWWTAREVVCWDTDVRRIEEITRGSANRAFRQWYLRQAGDRTESEIKTAIKKFFQFLAQDKGLTNEAVLKSLQR